jgi:acyl-CoA reductase-like NAD-dependent aldehyde dehydrogenase
LIVGGVAHSTQLVDVVHNPFDGSVVGEACAGGAAEIDAAIACAHEARREMRELPTHRRIAILEGVAQRIAAGADELARLMAREGGKPIRFARAEVARAVVTFKLAAAEAQRFGGEVLPLDLEPRGEGRLCIATRVPRGPIAAISPFNFPLNLVAHKLAPAIAVGAPFVLKPPPQCPLTALKLCDWILEAGLPPRGLSAVHCAPEIAQRMVVDERMAVLSFTGSDVVGWKLKALAGKKSVLLELGGNAPCVVDETADIASIVAPIALAAFAHGGQVCIKVQRIYVQRARFDDFVRRFVDAAGALACGDPLDEQTVVGPLIEERHVERVLAWIEEARQMGAKVHCGATRDGRVVRPTVLTGVAPQARVCKDEVFGPVAIVEPFDEFDDALALCNSTRFGLQAGVFTSDLARALRAGRELEYGGVMINEVPTFRVDNFPYGGTKDSGLGREGVRYAMEEFTEPRVLVLRGAQT